MYMPLRKKYNRPRRRHQRRGKKGPRRIKNTSIVPLNASPVARRHLVRMKYNDTIPIASLNSGNEYSHAFRMNSTFDPDRTGTGHQPYGRDTLAALYEHYRVYKFAWFIQSPSTSDRYNICVLPYNSSTPPANMQLASEMPLSRVKAMGFGGCPPATFKGSVYLPKLAGVPTVRYKSEVDYASTVATNPSEVLDLIMFIENVSSITLTFDISVTLWYYVEWYDPLTLGSS